MMRPFTDPQTTHPVPTLWERAKAVFTTLTANFGHAMRLARRIAALQREHFSAPWPRRLRATRRAYGCPEF